MPSKNVTDFVSKAFAILDFCDERIKKSLLGEKIAGKLAFKKDKIRQLKKDS